MISRDGVRSDCRRSKRSEVLFLSSEERTFGVVFHFQENFYEKHKSGNSFLKKVLSTSIIYHFQSTVIKEKHTKRFCLNRNGRPSRTKAKIWWKDLYVHWSFLIFRMNEVQREEEDASREKLCQKIKLADCRIAYILWRFMGPDSPWGLDRKSMNV